MTDWEDDRTYAASAETGDVDYPLDAVLADRIHDALMGSLGDCPEVDGQPACFTAMEAVVDTRAVGGPRYFLDLAREAKA